MRSIILAIALLFLFWGCGYKEGVSSGSQKSYLYFTGNTADLSVSVDNGAQFRVKNGRDNQYKVPPGKHLITVYRADQLIIKREIFLSDGIAKEIEVH
ncbi:MAG: hypothetical protein U9N52_09325 [Campylobacterota bacterium]|nr:hypothetical protein [Campylobacterota bacterium]